LQRLLIEGEVTEMTATLIWAFPGDVTDRQLEGFEVRAPDGTIGTVDKATYDVGASYLVVDTGPWIFGKRVLLPAGVIHRVDREAGVVHVSRTRDEIRSAPELEAGAVSDVDRERIGAYYSPGSLASESPRGRAQPARRSRRAKGRTRASTSTSARRRGTARGGRSSSEGPTRDELYEEAKRLGIEGRSKMNKRGLAQAVSRAKARRSGRTSAAKKASPADVQRFLDGVSYPTKKGDLLREARKRRASAKVRSTLERLPDRRFKAPTEVSQAIGRSSGARR
jgi:uncharacterized protein DUF2795